MKSKKTRHCILTQYIPRRDMVEARHTEYFQPYKRVISTLKFGFPHLTLKEGPKVKSVHTRRFPAHDFLYVGLPSQTSRANNKRVISTFKFGYPRLILKEGPKVKFDHTRRFPAHDFLCWFTIPNL